MKFIIILLLLPVLAFAQEDFIFTMVEAEQGVAEAQYNLGVMYSNGTGVPENDAEALKWYRLAAAQGLARAQSNLGFMYDNGEGVPENDAEAVKWYRLAAAQGLALAQYNLGVMYGNGTGVPQNFARAYLWFSMAAALGQEGARGKRDQASAQLTVGARNEAQQQATRCFDSGFKDCD